jgi:regulator of replication initiation timing
MSKTTAKGDFEVDGVTASRSSSQEEVDALRAENERLRAALTKIQYLEASDADTWIWTAQETAREALADEQQAPKGERSK